MASAAEDVCVVPPSDINSKPSNIPSEATTSSAPKPSAKEAAQTSSPASGISEPDNEVVIKIANEGDSNRDLLHAGFEKLQTSTEDLEERVGKQQFIIEQLEKTNMVLEKSVKTHEQALRAHEKALTQLSQIINGLASFKFDTNSFPLNTSMTQDPAPRRGKYGQVVTADNPGLIEDTPGLFERVKEFRKRDLPEGDTSAQSPAKKPKTEQTETKPCQNGVAKDTLVDEEPLVDVSIEVKSGDHIEHAWSTTLICKKCTLVGDLIKCTSDDMPTDKVKRSLNLGDDEDFKLGSFKNTCLHLEELNAGMPNLTIDKRAGQTTSELYKDWLQRNVKRSTTLPNHPHLKARFVIQKFDATKLGKVHDA